MRGSWISIKRCCSTRGPRVPRSRSATTAAHFVGAVSAPQRTAVRRERSSGSSAIRCSVSIARCSKNVPIDYVPHLSATADSINIVSSSCPIPDAAQASAPRRFEYVQNVVRSWPKRRLGWNNERDTRSIGVRGSAVGRRRRQGAPSRGPERPHVLVWSSGDLPGVNKGDQLPGRWYKETLEPTSPTARIVGHFEDGSAAAVMSTYGKGRTLMLGSYVSAAYQSTPTPAVERFYSGLLEWAGVTLPLTVAGAPLEARHLESGADAVLVLLNHHSQPAVADVSLRRPTGDYSAEDLINSRPVVVTRSGESVSVKAEVGHGQRTRAARRK